MTVADLLAAWTDKALPNRELADSAITSHKRAIRILVEEIGNVKVRRLTPDQVEAAFLRRTKPTGAVKRGGRGRTTGAALSRSSLIKIRSTLSQALKWAQRRNLVARNVANLVEIPAAAAKPKSGKSLTVAEAKLLLAAVAGTDLEAMWVVMLYLGLRPGEAAGLSWGDLDFDAGTVHVWRSRKTGASGNSIVGSTKTPGSIRTLDAPQPVLDSFARHRRRQHEQRLAAGSWWTNEENLVFTSPSGKPCDSSAVRKEFREVISASRVEGHWTPNLLRHSAASLMADAGMPGCRSNSSPISSAIATSACCNATTVTASVRPSPAAQSSTDSSPSRLAEVISRTPHANAQVASCSPGVSATVEAARKIWFPPNKATCSSNSARRRQLSAALRTPVSTTSLTNALPKRTPRLRCR